MGEHFQPQLHVVRGEPGAAGEPGQPVAVAVRPVHRRDDLAVRPVDQQRVDGLAVGHGRRNIEPLVHGEHATADAVEHAHLLTGAFRHRLGQLAGFGHPQRVPATPWRQGLAPIGRRNGFGLRVGDRFRGGLFGVEGSIPEGDEGRIVYHLSIGSLSVQDSGTICPRLHVLRLG